MIAMTVAKIILASRERQVLEGLAVGKALSVVALDLKIREGAAADYLKVAKVKLHGVSDAPSAVAVGYATNSITRPPLLDRELLFLPREQRLIVPLVARGLAPAQMATELDRPVADVRADGRELLMTLRACNRSHLMTKAWQYRVLTADQVIPWLR
ncbi:MULTISPECIES: hypothetical protein [unclassified Streptomyces]|uniref:hypothetical protein n=2 Tax=Streptomyces TaxID=1883 RepID=UPI0037F75C0D